MLLVISVMKQGYNQRETPNEMPERVIALAAVSQSSEMYTMMH